MSVVRGGKKGRLPRYVAYRLPSSIALHRFVQSSPRSVSFHSTPESQLPYNMFLTVQDTSCVLCPFYHK